VKGIFCGGILKVASCAETIADDIESSAPASTSVREPRAIGVDGLENEFFAQTLGDTEIHFVKNRTEALLWRHSEPSQAPAYIVVVFA